MNRNRRDGRRIGHAHLLALLVAALVVGAIVSLDIGATQTGLSSVPGLIRALRSGHSLTPDEQVGWLVISGIRLPRLVTAILVGGALAMSGATMQGLFRNPLADPGLIGVSAGAALATAFVIVLGDGWLSAWIQPLGRWAQPVAGLLGALAGAALLTAIATRGGVTSVATVLLGGIALAAFSGALTGLLVYLADDRALRDLSFWTLGSLSGASWRAIGAALPFLAIGTLCLSTLAPALDALLLGEVDAFHMGHDVEHTKRLALTAVAALTGASVALVGIVGFIGVLVPNFVRLIVGPSHRTLIPACACLGGLLLILSDTLARTIAAPAEVPVGVVTALIGAPAFLWLLLRGDGRVARL